MNHFIARLRGNIAIRRCRLFRKNSVIGSGLKLFGKLVIKGKGKVIIGQDCTISGIQGDRSQYVTLYTHSPDAVITIGNKARLYAARFSCRFSITIGDEVLIEEAGIADTDFHSLDISRKTPNETSEKCRIMIGNRVSIGSRSLINKGVRIGEDAIVCPGSIVSASVPGASIVSGNPARISRGSSDCEVKVLQR